MDLPLGHSYRPLDLVSDLCLVVLDYAQCDHNKAQNEARLKYGLLRLPTVEFLPVGHSSRSLGPSNSSRKFLELSDPRGPRDSLEQSLEAP